MDQQKKRDYYFDNARFFLIALVVLGHLISPYKDQSQFLYTTYNFIYSFHMPAFILISGFFSKNFFRKGYLIKIAQKVLVPYFIFQLLYSTFYTIQASELNFTLLDPYWTLWFLLSLLFWNIMLVLFSRLKFPLLIAIVLGISVGFDEGIGSFLSLSRTFVFFPLFLLGYFLNHQHFRYLLTLKARIMSAVFLSGLYLAYYYVIPHSAKDWLLASTSYINTDVDLVWAPVIRLTMYAVIILASFSFLSLVPNKKFIFTPLGARTLYIYLLHGVVIKLLSLTNLFEITTNSFAMFIIGAITLTFVLGWQPVIHATKPLIEGSYWFKRDRTYIKKSW